MREALTLHKTPLIFQAKYGIVFFYQKLRSTLTHCVLVDSSSVICWTSPFVILGVWVYFVALILFMMTHSVSKNVDPDLSDLM